MCAYEKGTSLACEQAVSDILILPYNEGRYHPNYPTCCSGVVLVVDAAVVFGAALHCCPKEGLFSGGGGDTDWLLLAFPTTPQKGPKIKRKREGSLNSSRG